MKFKYKTLLFTLLLIFSFSTIALSNQSFFSDVSPTAWYYNAVNHVANKSIMQGYENKFRPTDNVTRAELATVVSNLINNNTSSTITVQQYDEHIIALVSKATSSVVQIKTVKNGEPRIATGIVLKGNKILTNHHVIENASSIQVIVSNGKSYTGTVEQVDASNDLALLSVPEADELRYLEFETEVKSGQGILVIGNPHSYTNSVTKGVVSHTDRKGKIQIDAGVNKGNSGSPVISISSGKVLGLIATKLNGQDVENISFAVRADVILDFLDGNIVIYMSN